MSTQTVKIKKGSVGGFNPILKAKDLSKKYKDEWVLVEVLKESKQNKPVELRVLAHTKNREKIYDTLLKTAGRAKHLAVIFTGEVLQEDYAAAFIYVKD